MRFNKIRAPNLLCYKVTVFLHYCKKKREREKNEAFGGKPGKPCATVTIPLDYVKLGSRKNTRGYACISHIRASEPLSLLDG